MTEVICSICGKKGWNGFRGVFVSEVGKVQDFCPDCVSQAPIRKETGIPGRLNSLDPKRFMYSDKEWKKDIQSRRSLPDGTVGRFKDGKRYR